MSTIPPGLGELVRQRVNAHTKDRVHEVVPMLRLDSAIVVG